MTMRGISEYAWLEDETIGSGIRTQGHEAYF